jgi:transposase
MFLRRLHQTRNGRTYTYYSLVETVRSSTGAVRQRTICYLGRLDNLRPPDWLRIAERLPDPAWLPRLQQEVGYVPPPSTCAVATVAVIPESISWCHPRRLGDVYVALRAWQHLGFDRLLQRLVGRVATCVPMPLVAALIAVNRLVAPRSERGIFHWLPSTALPELLDFRLVRLSLNHLYRCLSLVEPHKLTIEQHLAEQGRDLFHFTNDLLLYDLTSTYFEGRLDHNPKAQRGYSRDHRPDCKQLCIGLVVNREGFPLGYESLAGNRRDADTLLPMITALERRFGVCPRILCFDRGMATEANLRELRQSHRRYLCATRRAVVRQHLPVIRSGPWIVVQTTHRHEPTIEVQELTMDCQPSAEVQELTMDCQPSAEVQELTMDCQPSAEVQELTTDCQPSAPAAPARTATDPTDSVTPERWLLCRSAGCRRKEQQIFDARLTKARQRLSKLREQVAAGTFVNRAVILAKAKKAVGRTHDLQGIFTFALQRTADGQQLYVQENATAMQDERDLQGVYLLRTTVADLPPDELWQTYMLLTRVEAAFRNLKTDLSIRPIFHHKENRGDAHVLFAVLAYALSVTIQLRHRQHGGALTTAALLETLQPLGLAELSYQTTDGSRLVFERAAVPSAAQQAILETLGWTIPDRYLPPNLEAEPRRVV